MKRQIISSILFLCIVSTVALPCFAKKIGSVTFKITKAATPQQACNQACSSAYPNRDAKCCNLQVNRNEGVAYGDCCSGESVLNKDTFLQFEKMELDDGSGRYEWNRVLR